MSEPSTLDDKCTSLNLTSLKMQLKHFHIVMIFNQFKERKEILGVFFNRKAVVPWLITLVFSQFIITLTVLYIFSLMSYSVVTEVQ